MRSAIPFETDDLSALARALRGELAACARTPGHVELLNMLARASGRRNFQHLRADAEARGRLALPPPAEQPVDARRVERTARHFDRDGRLVRWPGKASERLLCLWAVWARLPARQEMSEKAVNARLDDWHGFGDYAVIRRSLCDHGLLWRTPNGRVYRRVESRPPPEAAALIRHLELRRA